MAKPKRYHKDFKLQAAELVVKQGYSQSEAARRLGVSSAAIAGWIRHFRQSGELVVDEKALAEAEELRRLRKENRQLQLENEILKKAAAYFAKESL